MVADLYHMNIHFVQDLEDFVVSAPDFFASKEFDSSVYFFLGGGNHNTNRWKHISGPSFWENPPISFSGSTSSTP